MAKNLGKLRVYILGEDRQHLDFIRHFLVKAGVNRKRIVPAAELPEGRGSGTQYVRENFAEAHKKYKLYRENVLLIIVQDLDTIKISADRVKGSFCALVGCCTGNVGNVLFVLPRRNVETWYEWFGKQQPHGIVDENLDYKSKHKSTKASVMAKSAYEHYLASLSNQDLCKNAPNSLVAACNDFQAFCDKFN